RLGALRASGPRLEKWLATVDWARFARRALVWKSGWQPSTGRASRVGPSSGKVAGNRRLGALRASGPRLEKWLATVDWTRFARRALVWKSGWQPSTGRASRVGPSSVNVACTRRLTPVRSPR